MTHNKSINDINRFITRLGRLAKAEKLEEKQNKRQQIVERLRFVAEDMREAGASEQSIRLAVQGTYEFLKVTFDEKLDQSAEKMIKNPDSAFEHKKQMPVTVLS